MTTTVRNPQVSAKCLLGVDLGQAQDPTAIAVAEMREPDIHVRHLERLPLGTPYPRVIERVTAIIEKLPSPDLIVDATGLGRPVIDQMRETGLEPVPVGYSAFGGVGEHDDLVIATALVCWRLERSMESAEV